MIRLIFFISTLGVTAFGQTNFAQEKPRISQQAGKIVGQEKGDLSQRAEPQIEPAAQQLLKEVAQAYQNLKSIELTGEVTVNIDAGDQQQRTNQQFTSSFQAPNKFRHEMKGTLTLGSDGNKAYVFSNDDNSYLWLDAPGKKVSMQELPPVIPQVLQTQNPSLLFALSKEPLDELVKSFGKVTKAEEKKIDGKMYPGLTFVSEKDRSQLVIRIDPKTHLIRQVVLDFKPSLEQRGTTNVNAANVVVNYSSIKPEATFSTGHFAWTPPKGALDVRESAGAQRDEPTSRGSLTGKPAPDFVLPSLDGKKVSLSQLKGQVVVLDFWATWCPPCVKSLPIVADVHEDEKDENVKVFAVNLRESKDKVQTFLKEKQINIPVLLDERGEVARLYNVEAIPQTVIIGTDGRIKKVLVGAGPDLEEELREAIKSASEE